METRQQAQPALAVRELTVRIVGKAPLVNGVSFSVSPGECVAIVGRSGAGKSVLAQTLLGMKQDDGWEVRAEQFSLAGADVLPLSARQRRRLRGEKIALVLQDALQSLDPLRTIGAEVQEVLRLHGVGRARRRELSLAALGKVGLPQPEQMARRRSGQLSGGMRQRALIAAALVSDPEVIVADEPTTALDSVVASHVIDLLGEIRDQGKALIFISHDLSAVSKIADRIAVMDNGQIVEVGTTEQIFSHPKHPVTTALLAATRRPCAPPAAPIADAEPAISTTDVNRAFAVPGGNVQALSNASLDVFPGQATGIVGSSGSGKTTLARILVRADRPDSGTLRLSRPDLRIRLIPQDPLATFDPRWKVGQILSASLRGGAGGIAELLAAVDLPPAVVDRNPITLSGGERQRVAIARALAAAPDVLVCDEPVSALDSVTQAEILELFSSLQRDRQLTILFISHDLSAVRGLCQRIAVMSQGRIVEQGDIKSVLSNPQQADTRALVRAEF